MSPELDPRYKPLYANLLRAGIGKFLISEEFRLLLIEDNVDDLWNSCLKVIYRNSSVAILSPGFTGDAKDALALFLPELHRNDSEYFLEIMNIILKEFLRWPSAPPETKPTQQLLERIADALLAVGYRTEQVESFKHLQLSEYEGAQMGASVRKVGEPGKKTKNKSVAEGHPRVFVGSSAEGLPVAEAIQLNLDYAAECTIWHQGVFGLSRGTLDSLVEATKLFDFAVLVLTPDDMAVSRAVEMNAPRDNVLFELGLFMGALGRNRTFIVHCRDEKIKFPSDLAGVTMADFAKRDDGNLQAALGPVCTRLKKEFQHYGRLPPD
jgi:predicted nucleotide-binding protein